MSDPDYKQLVDELCDPEIDLSEGMINYYLDSVVTVACRFPMETKAYIPSRDITPFLNALKTYTTEDTQHNVYSALKMIFAVMDPLQIITKYSKNLEDGLGANVPYEIHGVCLAQLLRISRDNNAVEVLADKEEILGLVVDRMDGHVCAPTAMHTLVEVLTRVPRVYKTLFEDRLQQRFQKVQEKDAVRKLRVYELYCRMAAVSAESTSRLTPQLQYVVNSFREDRKDPLVQLNYVELLTVLVSGQHTVQFIINSGVIPDMQKLLLDISNKRAVFLEPGVCEFFGRFGESHPRIMFEKHLDIVKFMIQLTRNPQFQAHAISNMGLIGRSVEGKRLLNDKLKLETVVLLKSIGEVLEGDDFIFKEAALTALSHLLDVEDTEQEDIVKLTQLWFFALCSAPLKIIWDCAKDPHGDVISHSLVTLRSIALLPWGSAALLEECAGFLEWVTKREINWERSEQEAKFAIVSALVENADKIKCPEARAALRAHLSEGPYNNYHPEVFIGRDEIVWG